jgi:uroporphyrinogen-III synthase
VRVLILRPEPGNSATAAQVAALGCEPICVPLFEVAPVAWVPHDPDDFDAVVMTSANAARHGGPDLAGYTHLPLYCVGEATADAARNAGFDDITTGDGGGDDLSELFGDRQRVLHLTGTDHRPLPAGVHVTTLPVYTSTPVAAALPDADIALVHSPRAGARLAELSPRRDLALIAISGAAAEAAGACWTAVHVADVPREAAMLATLAGLCKAGPR